MIALKMPMFMDNDDWWYVDEECQMQIKDDAPEEAKESYRAWIEMHEQRVSEHG